MLLFLPFVYFTHARHIVYEIKSKKNVKCLKVTFSLLQWRRKIRLSVNNWLDSIRLSITQKSLNVTSLFTVIVNPWFSYTPSNNAVAQILYSTIFCNSEGKAFYLYDSKNKISLACGNYIIAITTNKGLKDA